MLCSIIIIIIILLFTLFVSRINTLKKCLQHERINYNEHIFKTGDVIATMYDHKSKFDYIANYMITNFSCYNPFTHFAIIVELYGEKYIYGANLEYTYDNFTSSFKTGNTLIKLKDYIENYQGFLLYFKRNEPLNNNYVFDKIKQNIHKPFKNKYLILKKDDKNTYCISTLFSILVPQLENKSLNTKHPLYYLKHSGLYQKPKLMINKFLRKHY